MNSCVLLIGAPGSGKGTQASIISQKKKLFKISTGDLIRSEIKRESELGKRIKPIIAGGDLIDDTSMFELVKNELLSSTLEGFISDGFPRNLEQANLMKTLLSETFPQCRLHVFYLKIGIEKLLDRISKRRTCGQCGAVYNLVYHPPAVADVCDKCGGKLIQREDDVEHVVIKRHEIFEKTIEPMIQFYKRNLTIIDATLEKSNVTDLMLERI